MKHAHLIGSIYEAALDPGRLGGLLAAVASHAEATLGHIDIEDASSGEVVLAAAHGMTADMQDEYLRRYRALDPRRALLHGAPAGEWRLTQDHFDRARLERDPFHREFAIPGGGGHGAVTRLEFGHARGFLCLGRALRRGPFPETVRRRLARLTPHLRQAGNLAAQANLGLAMQFAHRALLDHLADAVIVVAREGRYLHGNASALALLETGDGLQATAGVVHACDPHAAALLARTIEAASRDDPRRAAVAQREASLRLPRPSGAAPWLASVLPIAPPTAFARGSALPCAAIWLRSPGREKRVTPAWLQFALDVTPAEARVAHAIFHGATLAEAAKQLGIGETTTKTHLARVFAKTGVHRQADLVRHIAGLKPDFR